MPQDSFRAHTGATRAGAGSTVPTTTVTVSLGCQQQGWHESAAGIVLPLRGGWCQGTGSQTNTPLCNISLLGLPHLLAWVTRKVFFQERKHHQNQRPRGYQHTKAEQQASWDSLSFTCPSAALKGIPPHPRALRRTGPAHPSIAQHRSREQHVPDCAPEQKKTTPCNLTVTEVLD